MAKKPKVDLKVCSIEISKFCDGDKERRESWKRLSVLVQEATNVVWEEWLAFHKNLRSRELLKTWLYEYEQYHKRLDDLGSKPDKKDKVAMKEWARRKEDVDATKPGYPPVSAVPDGFDVYVRKMLLNEFPRLNSRVRTLVLNKIISGIKTRKSANSKLSGWISILVHREGCPRFTNPLPIPVDVQNATLVPSESEGIDWEAVVRVQGLPSVDGKKGKSVKETLKLWTHGKKRGASPGVLAPRGSKRMSLDGLLRKIYAGDEVYRSLSVDEKKEYCGWRQNGSNLVFDDGKWFLMLAYNQPKPEKVLLDPSRRAVLCPGRNDPWMLLIDGKLQYFNGRGYEISAMRNRLCKEFLSRRGSYQHVSHAARGHGRKRAMKVIKRPEDRRWTNFVRSYNANLAKDLVRHLVHNGVGTLELLVPVGDRHLNARFVNTSGDTGDGVSRGWEYFDLKNKLDRHCGDIGIGFSEKKCSASGEMKKRSA